MLVPATRSHMQQSSIIMTPRVYIVPMAVFAPAVLTVVAVAVSAQDSWWYLTAIPFIWLGSICAQPNLNGADGCLAYLAMIVGFALLVLFKPLGVAIVAGSVSGFYLSAAEKYIRMRPASDD